MVHEYLEAIGWGEGGRAGGSSAGWLRCKWRACHQHLKNSSYGAHYNFASTSSACSFPALV